ncbi:hypothetical protein Syun_016197 [Stephania yunnanensis]|uniref:Uncharacterized protein n=1 Tax=Stephania yunnanensis TaxID=152371 RepID=A0AAP0J5H1_9MAGN
MASSWFGSSGATPHTMTMTNTPATRLLPMSQVRSSKLVLGLVAEMLRMPLEELCLQIKSLSLGYIRPFLMRAIEPPQEEAIASTLSVLYEEIILRMPELQKGDINIGIQQKQDVTKGAVPTIIL